MFDAIPSNRREDARSAMTTAFGRAPLTALKQVTSGASALIYRIEVADRPYLLRLDSLQRDEVRNPERAYLCMRTAVEAGIAPALHHADPTAGVAIMDYVSERPLSDYPSGRKGLARPRRPCRPAAGNACLPAGRQLSDRSERPAGPPAWLGPFQRGLARSASGRLRAYPPGLSLGQQRAGLQPQRPPSRQYPLRW